MSSSAASASPPSESGTGRTRSARALVAFLAISFAAATLGALSTIQNVDGWYAHADRAFWTPPNAVFGPIWTVLYTLMSVAAWLVWRERGSRDVRPALMAYVVQLVLNSLWTPVFFGLYPAAGSSALWIALVLILAIDAVVLVTMLRFWPVRRLAALLLIPYWAWVLYATTLNAYLAIKN